MTQSLRRFKPSGVELFGQYLDGIKTGAATPPPVWLLSDAAHTEVVEPETLVPDATFVNRLEAAKYLDVLFTKAELVAPDRDVGLWAWLSLRFFDQLCPAGAGGKRKPGQANRWIPEVHDNRRYYRHLLAGPYLIYRIYRPKAVKAMALLADRPHVATAEAYRLFVENPSLIGAEAAVATATTLYYDHDRGKMKRGYGRKTAGGCRRLMKVLQQLDCTFDMYSLTDLKLLALLPREFDPFKPKQFRLAI